MVSSRLSLASRSIPTLAALFLVALTGAAPGRLLAADGDLDPTFGSSGVRTVAFNLGGGFADYCSGITAAQDGTLFAVGYAESQTTDFDWVVAKLSDGVAPFTQQLFFDLGGSRNDRAQAVALDRSGRLLVAGDAANTDRNELRICRLLPGDLNNDPAFNSGGCVPIDAGAQTGFLARAVAEAPDLGILVAGSVNLPDGSGGDFNWFVLKLTAAGALDSSFGLNGIRTVNWNFVTHGLDLLSGMSVDALDGSIALVGSVTSSVLVGAMARLTATGDLDPSFGQGGTVWWVVPNGSGFYPTVGTAVLRDPIGNGYRVSGYAQISPGHNRLDLRQFDSAGSPLGSSQHSWGETVDYPRGLLLQSDRRFIVPGESGTGANFRASRFDIQGNGTLAPDGTYGTSGDAVFSPATAGWGTGLGVCAATLDAGRVVLLADFMNPDRDWMVIRLQNSSIFVDGFEPGNTSQWSLVAP